MSTARDIPQPAAEELPELPEGYMMTPGGEHMFSPGGTKIKYDRASLLLLSKSPLAQLSPLRMPVIHGVTSPSHNAADLVYHEPRHSPAPFSLDGHDSSGGCADDTAGIDDGMDVTPELGHEKLPEPTGDTHKQFGVFELDMEHR